jgi:uncharacterized membrane protein
MSQDEQNPEETDLSPQEVHEFPPPRVSVSPRPLKKTTPEYLIASKTEFQGPLPPPHFLREYNDIVPGAAERLLTEAEKNGEHRRWREKTALTAQVGRMRWGLAAGFTVAMSFLGVSGFLIGHGHDTAGTILGTVDLVALVGVFVARHQQTGSRREEDTLPPKKAIEKGTLPLETTEDKAKSDGSVSKQE